MCYRQVPLIESDSHKTAFRIKDKCFQWKVMPMGITNAPATFQRLIDRALEGIEGRYAHGYLDDIMVFSDTWDDHIEHLGDVLTRLRAKNLRLNVRKCQFGMAEVTFLGHVFSYQCMKIDPKKVIAIQSIQYPLDGTLQAKKKQIQRFLGMAGFCRRYIPRYSHIVKPLTDLLSNSTEWRWGKDESEAWDT